MQNAKDQFFLLKAQLRTLSSTMTVQMSQQQMQSAVKNMSSIMEKIG